MCRKTALFVLAFALWILWMSAPGAARAATLTVGQQTPACSKALYSTIQSAVNAASSGDTVHICAGPAAVPSPVTAFPLIVTCVPTSFAVIPFF